jgi:hypothetical protein
MDETTKFLERHHGHQLSGMPYVTADGWDARILECDKCHDHISQVRAIPAEGTLIDPDPTPGQVISPTGAFSRPS